MMKAENEDIQRGGKLRKVIKKEEESMRGRKSMRYNIASFH
jgi:hypothetical protein